MALLARTPYPHQMQGVKQIVDLCEQPPHKGAILKFGMGSGKTLTACLALKEIFLRYPQYQAALLLVPSSVLSAWSTELARLGDYQRKPRVLLFHGGDCGEEEVVQALEEGQCWVLTTCETWKKRLDSPRWGATRGCFSVLLVDESQNFKNAIPGDVGDKPAYSEVFAAHEPLLGGRRFTLLLSGTPFEARVHEMESAWFLLTGQRQREARDHRPRDREAREEEEDKFKQEMKALLEPCCIEIGEEGRKMVEASTAILEHRVQFLSTYGWPTNIRAAYAEKERALVLARIEYSEALEHGGGRSQRARDLLAIIRQLKSHLRGMCSHPLLAWGSEGKGPCEEVADNLSARGRRLRRGLPLSALSNKLAAQAGGPAAEAWPPVPALVHPSFGQQGLWFQGLQAPTPEPSTQPVLLAKFEFIYQQLLAWSKTHQSGRWVVTSAWVRVLEELGAYLRLRQQIEPAEGEVPAAWRLLRFYGSSSRAQRAGAEALFLEPEPPELGLAVLLLSKKAGGVGLNLTFADGLLLLEPGHTLAQDSQVVARVQRLGGRGAGPEPRCVRVYYLAYSGLGSLDVAMRKEHCHKARKVAMTALDQAGAQSELQARYTPEERGLGAGGGGSLPPEPRAPPRKKRRLSQSSSTAQPKTTGAEPEQLRATDEEEQRRAAELHRQGKEQRKQEKERRRQEKERRRQEKERRRQAEEQRRAAELRRKEEEQRRAAELRQQREEQRRLAELRRQAERRRQQEKQQEREEEAARERRQAARATISPAARVVFEQLLE